MMLNRSDEYMYLCLFLILNTESIHFSTIKCELAVEFLEMSFLSIKEVLFYLSLLRVFGLGFFSFFTMNGY